MLHEEITKSIIRAFYKVYNTLGHGFLEKVYENAMAYELTKRGVRVRSQMPIRVHYDGGSFRSAKNQTRIVCTNFQRLS